MGNGFPPGIKMDQVFDLKVGRKIFFKENSQLTFMIRVELLKKEKAQPKENQSPRAQ